MSDPNADPAAQTPAPLHCYRHPNREALVRCTRCERPICPDCMRPAAVGFHCPEDVRDARRTVRAPRTVVGGSLGSSLPLVTIGLVALNVIVYLAAGLQAGGSLGNPAGSRLFQHLQLFPETVHDGDYYQLLTSAFLHLSLLHIGANMLALAIIGPHVERLLGWWRFLALYLVAALGGGACVYVFSNPLTVTAGASGAIFGLFGASLVLVRKLGLDLQWLIAIIVLNFAITFSVPGISQEGHIGGFVVGLLAGLVIGGTPTTSSRVPTRLQAGGLVALLVLVVLVVAVRTATFPTV